MFGENPEDAMETIEWISYILSSLLINIVGLNLLISVITEVYNDVTAKLNAIDYKARLDQIMKIEKDIYNLNENNVRDDTSCQYLHHIHYASDEVAQDKNITKANEVNAEVKSIKKMLKKRYDNIHAKNKEILALIDEFDRKNASQ